MLQYECDCIFIILYSYLIIILYSLQSSEEEKKKTGDKLLLEMYEDQVRALTRKLEEKEEEKTAVEQQLETERKQRVAIEQMHKEQEERVRELNAKKVGTFCIKTVKTLNTTLELM